MDKVETYVNKRSIVKNCYSWKRHNYVVGTYWNCLIGAIPICTNSTHLYGTDKRRKPILKFNSMSTVFVSLLRVKLSMITNVTRRGPAVLTLIVFKLLLYLSSPNFPSGFAVLFLT